MNTPDALYEEIGKMTAGGSPEETVGALEMLLAVWPEYGPAHNDLGVLYFSLGEKEKALMHYEQAASLVPENSTFQKNLADFYYVEQGRTQEAMKIYVGLLSVNPSDVEVLLTFGRISFEQGVIDKAEYFFRRVLEIEPWNDDARRGLSGIGKEKGDLQKEEVGGQRAEVSGRTTDDGGQTSELGFQGYVVSAIVSTYNSERFIKGCLEDLEAQTIANQLEIIVVDSGSEQNEGDIVREFQSRYDNIKYIRTENRETVYAAWNRGIRASSGKYITNANTDDRHRRDAYEVMVKILEALPEVALVYADLLITETENETFERCTPVGRFRWLNWDRKDLLKGSCFMGPQPMWRRSVHEEYGYFEDSFVTSGDYEFWLRISQTHTFLHIPVLLGLYLRTSESIEHRNRKQQAEENRRILEIYNSENASKDIIKEPIAGMSDRGAASQTDTKNNGVAGMVSIIIAVLGKSRHLKKCVTHVKSHTTVPYEIIFVDSGMKQKNLKWVQQEAKSKSNYRLIKAEKNALLSQCYNKGIEASSGEYICLLADHIIVGAKWLEGMLQGMEKASKAGIIGPMTNSMTAGRQQVKSLREVSPSELEASAKTFYENNRNRRTPTSDLEGICILFSGRLARQLGPFDENLAPGSEAMDFCLRAQMEGFSNYIVGDVFVLSMTPTPKVEDRSFSHKWHNLNAKSSMGKKLGVVNALRDAETLFQKGEIDKAVSRLIEGIRYSPDDLIIYHRLAEILIDAERFEQALEAIGSIPKGDPNDPKTLMLTAYCKAGLEIYDEALELASRASRLDEVSGPALNLLGVLAHGRGKTAEAKDFFNGAVTADPGDGRAYTNLGMMAFAKGRKTEGLKLLEKGFLLTPTVSECITAYHGAILEMGETDRTLSLFYEAKDLYPQNRRIAFLLIDILIQNGEYEPAIHHTREAMVTFGIDEGILSAAKAILERVSEQDSQGSSKKPALSLCMIVKDEEECLPRCLYEAVPIADEIIVVDTGSTDRTKTIAEAFGAKVYEFDWTNDFSEARNFSLAKATGKWILILDADEVISPLDHKRILSIVNKPLNEPKAYSITTRNYVKPPYVTGWTCNEGQYPDEEAGTGWYPSRKVRLFPNDPRIRFESAVHELVEGYLKRSGIPITRSKIPVHHYGQLDRAKYKSKGKAYYLLGKQKLEERGDDLQALVELAVQAGSELEEYEEAIELWERVLNIDPNNKKAYLNIGYNRLKLGHYDRALKAAKKAMELDADLKEAVVVYATGSVLLGDAEGAVPMLEQLMKKFPKYPTATAILSSAYRIAGKSEKAMKHMRYLTNLGFACDKYLHDLSERLLKTGNKSHAVSLLEFAVESGNGSDEINELRDRLHGK